MGGYNKYNKDKFGSMNIISILVVLLILVVIMLSIGYSAFQTGVDISEISATIRVEENIRITGLGIANLTNQASSNYETFGINNINSSISLPNSNSTVTYDIVITNIGNIEMGISNIRGLPDNLSYSLTEYALGRALCDDNNSANCKNGTVTTLRITIGYALDGYDGENTTFTLGMIFNFASVNDVARINDSYYSTLQNAVNSIHDSNETTIVLLKNTAEAISVSGGQNILLDLGNLIISNNGSTPVIEINTGSVKMFNGTITSSASQGAINVHNGSSFTITGGKIIATGLRQAIYNNGGTVYIGGTAYLSSVTNQRATVHNVDSRGSITVTGGTITSASFAGILNAAGSLTIGTSDGSVNTTSPVIQGGTYGVNNSSTSGNVTTLTNFNFYDGILKGKTKAIYDEDHILNKELGYGILPGIDGVYKTASLAHIVKITLDANEGEVSESTKIIEVGNRIGTLPIPTREDYVFDGWFDETGNEIDSDDQIYNDIRIIAGWTHIDDVYVARIGQNQYHTLTEAISSIKTSAQTTITLIRNTSENVTIPSGRNIILNMQSYKLISPGDDAVIVNKGTCTITSGTILTNSSRTSAINNNSKATLTMTGGSILATGLRQTIYNDGGTVTISDNAYLRATAPERATVQNHTTGGSIIITGGTIVSVNYSAVYNEAGTLIVGVKDGNIDTTTPVFKGAIYGITNAATFKLYDGIIKGVSAAISGNTNEMEQNSQIVNTTETIDNNIYNVLYLE